jgi:hypothetical protein
MNPGRNRKPGQWPTFAALLLAALALVTSAGVEFGWVRSPFDDHEPPKPEAQPRATPKPVAKAKPAARPEPKPASPVEIVHDEEPTEPVPPAAGPTVKHSPAVASTVKAEVDQTKAARQWRARLALLHRRMHNRGVDAGPIARKAVEEINRVVDPSAAPALWQVFAGHPAHHLLLAGRLAALESSASSRMLAALAVYSPDEKARVAAFGGLKGRDPVDFAGPLIALLGPELKCRAGFLPSEPGGPILQALEVEDERFIKQFVYFAEPNPGDPAASAFGCGAMPTELEQAHAGVTQELAVLQLRSDLQAVDALNLRIGAINARVRAILTQASGADYGLDRDSWFGWLASKSGKTYVPPKQVAKIPLQEFVEPIYVPTFVPAPPEPS